MGITDDADANSTTSAPTSSSAPSDDEVDDAELYRLQLPCAELQQLTRLSRLSVKASACMCSFDPELSTQPLRQQHHHGVTHGSARAVLLPKLKDMKLVGCKLASLESMQQLFDTVRPQLTKLHVEQLCWPSSGCLEELGPSSCGAFTEGRALPLALQSCSNLKFPHFLQRPDFRGAGMWSALSVVELGGLQKLQELVFYWPHPAPATYLPGFRPSLTQLSLTSWASDLEEPLLLPQLAELQHLRALKLQNVQLSVTTLFMTRLQSLQLEGLAVDSTTLGSMTQLQQLVLHHCHGTTPVHPQQCDGHCIKSTVLCVALVLLRVDSFTSHKEVYLHLHLCGSLPNACVPLLFALELCRGRLSGVSWQGCLKAAPRLAPALLRQLRADIKHLQHKAEEQQTTITQLKLLSQHGD